MHEILKVEGLKKAYKNHQALKGIDIEVSAGEVFGLLGPNGSGKTTTLGILMGVLKPNGGTFSWFKNGQAVSNRRNIGTLLETPNFYPYLNATDNLKIVGKIKSVEAMDEEIERVLKNVDLWKRKEGKFKTYSLGMKQRLAIAAAMLGDPDVLVLDEPTNGLDPRGIAEIRDIILAIAKKGKTIIIASHILDEIEKVCTHVAILKDGEIIQHGSLEEIMTQDKLVWVSAMDNDHLKQMLESLQGLRYIKTEGTRLLIGADDDLSPSRINQLLAEKGLFLNHISVHRKNLESTFLEIIDK